MQNGVRTVSDKITKSGIDIADLYDADVVRVGKVWRELMYKYGRKRATRLNLEELEKEARDEMFKIGLVATVDTSACYLGVGMPVLQIDGRVPGHEFNTHGLDHSRKRVEVLESRERGEAYLGEKDGKTL